MVPTKEKDINAVTGKNKIWNSCTLTDKYIETYFCYQKLFMFSFVAFIPMLEIKYIVFSVEAKICDLIRNSPRLCSCLIEKKNQSPIFSLHEKGQ